MEVFDGGRKRREGVEDLASGICGSSLNLDGPRTTVAIYLWRAPGDTRSRFLGLDMSRPSDVGTVVVTCIEHGEYDRRAAVCPSKKLRTKH